VGAVTQRLQRRLSATTQRHLRQADASFAQPIVEVLDVGDEVGPVSQTLDGQRQRRLELSQPRNASQCFVSGCEFECEILERGGCFGDFHRHTGSSAQSRGVHGDAPHDLAAQDTQRISGFDFWLVFLADLSRRERPHCLRERTNH